MVNPHRATLLMPIVICACAIFGTGASAWHCEGHRLITEGALQVVKDSLPQFITAGRATIIEASCEPDMFRLQWATQLKSQESPEHFIDLELLDGTALPDTRPQFVNLCHAKEIDPFFVGYLPYAVAEWAERLAIALAQYRFAPNDSGVRNQCLVYAGILSHYAGDLCMPLHVTLHFDGKVPAGSTTSPRSGIHEKVDALVGKVPLTVLQLAQGVSAGGLPRSYITDIVREELRRSAALVNRVYELEPKIPAVPDPITDSAVREFSIERARAGMTSLSQLYLAAWRASQKFDLPSWYTNPSHKR